MAKIKNRWRSYVGPSYWRCMNVYCTAFRKLLRWSLLAHPRSCSECGKTVYRSKIEEGEASPTSGR